MFGGLEVLAGLMLIIGFLTPLAGLAVTAGYLAVGMFPLLATNTNGHLNQLADYIPALTSFALVLIGPGAYSLDARMFGRREIVIPERRRPS